MEENGSFIFLWGFVALLSFVRIYKKVEKHSCPFLLEFPSLFIT